MGQDAAETDVIFKREDKSVIAIFPEIPGTGAYDVTCYAHIGQHGSASLGYVKSLKPARSAEYAPLQRELEQVGYKLRIVKRLTSRHAKKRQEACQA